jgi:hypothetical protein
MATIVHAKVVFGLNLGKALSDAKMNAGVGDFENMGDSDANRSDYVAYLVNQTIEDLLTEVPLLGNMTEELELKSGETTLYVFPSTLRNADIKSLKFIESSGLERPTPVDFMPRDKFREYAEATYQSMHAGRYKWSFSEDGVDIEVFPTPPTGATLKAYFGIAPAAITAGNVDSPSAVNMPEVPVMARDWFCLKLGEKLAQKVNPDRTERLFNRAETAMRQLIVKLTSSSVHESTLGGSGVYDDDAIFSSLGGC